MTVCLTGDVHHMSLETREHPYMDRTEADAAVEYAGIAAEHGVPVTLFLTGRLVREEPGRVDRLAAMDHVELGGHNYWAFDTPVHRGWRLLEKATGGRVGSWNGPRRFQAHEIDRTVAAFADRGIGVSAWRDHAYRRDDHTAPLLADRGFTHLSDAVGPDERIRREAGVTVVPINTPPDHEHVYHAFRTPEFVARSDVSGPFGEESREVGAWLEWVWDAIGERIDAGRPATVLAHPACMRLTDGLETFASLCERVADSPFEATTVSGVEP